MEEVVGRCDQCVCVKWMLFHFRILYWNARPCGSGWHNLCDLWYNQTGIIYSCVSILNLKNIIISVIYYI